MDWLAGAAAAAGILGGALLQRLNPWESFNLGKPFALPVANGMLWSWAFLRFPSPLDAVFFSLLATLLLWVTLIDLKSQRIPNPLLAAGLGAGLLYGLVQPGRLLPSLWGLLAVGGLMFLLAILSRGGLGFGDVKLAAVVGLFLGAAQGLAAIVIAFLTGALVGLLLLLLKRKGMKDYLAFGPYIALGAWVSAVWGETILRAWFGLS